MTSWIVIDSGALIAAAIEETYTAQANSEAEALMVAVPMLLRYEVASTLRKLAYRGQLRLPTVNVCSRKFEAANYSDD